MTIDLKKLQKTIEAEVNRREYERVAANAESAKPFAHVPQDIVRAFEPMQLEAYLPPAPDSTPEPQPETSSPEAAPAEPQAPSLYRKLRGLPVVGKYIGHQRVMHFLTRVRQRPGGVTVKNVFVLLAKAVIMRIPGGYRLARILVSLRYMPESMDSLHFHISDANSRLRTIGLQVQNQVNESLYTHALAIQQNEHYLISRMQLLERRVREQALTIAQWQAQEPGANAQAFPARVEEPGMPAELYLEFEANFRGSKEMIRERLKANLVYFRENAALFSDPVLDLGCGRGEWLQLLKEENIPAIGVDFNTAMIQCCTDAGLEAYVGDALQYLAALPANSLGGLTAFHIIEHLPLDVFIRLIDEARRVVRPGGVVLFETPNPENLIVGACNFYIDPTHRNPLPPALVAFLLKARGFERVEIDRRHPGDPALLLKGDDEAITGPLNRLLFGAQDYAAIGYAPE